LVDLEASREEAKVYVWWYEFRSSGDTPTKQKEAKGWKGD
jgi:hypothetical protein